MTKNARMGVGRCCCGGVEYWAHTSGSLRGYQIDSTTVATRLARMTSTPAQGYDVDYDNGDLYVVDAIFGESYGGSRIWHLTKAQALTADNVRPHQVTGATQIHELDDTGSPDYTHFAVDHVRQAGKIYFTVTSGDAGANDQLRVIDEDGGGEATIYTHSNDTDVLTRIVVHPDNDYAFVTEEVGTTRKISRIGPLSGAATRTELVDASGRPFKDLSIDYHDDKIWWVEEDQVPTPNEHLVKRANFDGTGAETMDQTATTANPINNAAVAHKSGRLYISRGGLGLYHVDREFAESEVLVCDGSGGGDPLHLAAPVRSQLLPPFENLGGYSAR